MLSEINQSPEDNYCMFSLICGSWGWREDKTKEKTKKKVI
jgi:hypothetical protein